jgi:hypothetical protein
LGQTILHWAVTITFHPSSGYQDILIQCFLLKKLDKLLLQIYINPIKLVCFLIMPKEMHAGLGKQATPIWGYLMKGTPTVRDQCRATDTK